MTLLGDGLVTVRSALGDHSGPRLDLGIPPDNRWVGYGLKHRDLLTSPDVRDVLREWLAG